MHLLPQLSLILDIFLLILRISFSSLPFSSLLLPYMITRFCWNNFLLSCQLCFKYLDKPLSLWWPIWYFSYLFAAHLTLLLSVHWTRWYIILSLLDLCSSSFCWRRSEAVVQAAPFTVVFLGLGLSLWFKVHVLIPPNGYIWNWPPTITFYWLSGSFFVFVIDGNNYLNPTNHW